MGNRLIFLYLVIFVRLEGVTEKDSEAIDWLLWFKLVGGRFRQIRSAVNTEK